MSMLMNNPMRKLCYKKKKLHVWIKLVKDQ